MSIYRGVDVDANGGVYFMLGISLVGFAVVEIIMVSRTFVEFNIFAFGTTAHERIMQVHFFANFPPKSN